jgi:hypothetical protein
MKICTLFLILVGASFAQDDKPTQHSFAFFVSAEDYKNNPIGERMAYLSGWLDSRLNGGAFGNAKTIKAMRDCVGGPQGKTITQITAIIDKYVQGHPETWERPAALEADAALKDACPALRQVVDGQ